MQQTLIAFNARRDASKPAGEYDFALRPNGVVSTGADAECERSRTNGFIAGDYLDETLSRRGSAGGHRESVGGDDAVNGCITGWPNIVETTGRQIFSAFPSLTKIDERIRACRGRAVCGASDIFATC